MRYVDCIWVDEPPMDPTSGSFSFVGVYRNCAMISEVVQRNCASSSSSSYTLHLLYCVYIVLYCHIDLPSMLLPYFLLLVVDDLVYACFPLFYVYVILFYVYVI